MHSRKFLFGLFLVVLFIIGFIIFEALPRGLGISDGRDSLVVGEETFSIDVARNAVERARGLSGRESLGANEGLLFLFDNPDFHGFWMKDMKFPIDMVWIRGDKVVGWQEYAQPDDSPDRAVYYPPEPADKVLEVPAGTVFRLGLRIDDIIKF